MQALELAQQLCPPLPLEASPRQLLERDESGHASWPPTRLPIPRPGHDSSAAAPDSPPALSLRGGCEAFLHLQQPTIHWPSPLPRGKEQLQKQSAGHGSRPTRHLGRNRLLQQLEDQDEGQQQQQLGWQFPSNRKQRENKSEAESEARHSAGGLPSSSSPCAALLWPPCIQTGTRTGLHLLLRLPGSPDIRPLRDRDRNRPGQDRDNFSNINNAHNSSAFHAAPVAATATTATATTVPCRGNKSSSSSATAAATPPASTPLAATGSLSFPSWCSEEPFFKSAISVGSCSWGPDELDGAADTLIEEEEAEEEPQAWKDTDDAASGKLRRDTSGGWRDVKTPRAARRRSGVRAPTGPVAAKAAPAAAEAPVIHRAGRDPDPAGFSIGFGPSKSATRGATGDVATASSASAPSPTSSAPVSRTTSSDQSQRSSYSPFAAYTWLLPVPVGHHSLDVSLASEGDQAGRDRQAAVDSDVELPAPPSALSLSPPPNEGTCVRQKVAAAAAKPAAERSAAASRVKPVALPAGTPSRRHGGGSSASQTRCECILEAPEGSHELEPGLGQPLPLRGAAAPRGETGNGGGNGGGAVSAMCLQHTAPCLASPTDDLDLGWRQLLAGGEGSAALLPPFLSPFLSAACASPSPASLPPPADKMAPAAVLEAAAPSPQRCERRGTCTSGGSDRQVLGNFASAVDAAQEVDEEGPTCQAAGPQTGVLAVPAVVEASAATPWRRAVIWGSDDHVALPTTAAATAPSPPTPPATRQVRLLPCVEGEDASPAAAAGAAAADAGGGDSMQVLGRPCFHGAQAAGGGAAVASGPWASWVAAPQAPEVRGRLLRAEKGLAERCDPCGAGHWRDTEGEAVAEGDQGVTHCRVVLRAQSGMGGPRRTRQGGRGAVVFEGGVVLPLRGVGSAAADGDAGVRVSASETSEKTSESEEGGAEVALTHGSPGDRPTSLASIRLDLPPLDIPGVLRLEMSTCPPGATLAAAAPDRLAPDTPADSAAAGTPHAHGPGAPPAPGPEQSAVAPAAAAGAGAGAQVLLTLPLLVLPPHVVPEVRQLLYDMAAEGLPAAPPGRLPELAVTGPVVAAVAASVAAVAAAARHDDAVTAFPGTVLPSAADPAAEQACAYNSTTAAQAAAGLAEAWEAGAASGSVPLPSPGLAVAAAWVWEEHLSPLLRDIARVLSYGGGGTGGKACRREGSEAAAAEAADAAERLFSFLAPLGNKDQLLSFLVCEAPDLMLCAMERASVSAVATRGSAVAEGAAATAAEGAAVAATAPLLAQCVPLTPGATAVPAAMLPFLAPAARTAPQRPADALTLPWSYSTSSTAKSYHSALQPTAPHFLMRTGSSAPATPGSGTTFDVSALDISSVDVRSAEEDSATVPYATSCSGSVVATPPPPPSPSPPPSPPPSPTDFLAQTAAGGHQAAPLGGLANTVVAGAAGALYSGPSTSGAAAIPSGPSALGLFTCTSTGDDSSPVWSSRAETEDDRASITTTTAGTAPWVCPPLAAARRLARSFSEAVIESGLAALGVFDSPLVHRDTTTASSASNSAASDASATIAAPSRPAVAAGAAEATRHPAAAPATPAAPAASGEAAGAEGSIHAGADRSMPARVADTAALSPPSEVPPQTPSPFAFHEAPAGPTRGGSPGSCSLGRAAAGLDSPGSLSGSSPGGVRTSSTGDTASSAHSGIGVAVGVGLWPTAVYGELGGLPNFLPMPPPAPRRRSGPQAALPPAPFDSFEAEWLAAEARGLGGGGAGGSEAIACLLRGF